MSSIAQTPTTTSESKVRTQSYLTDVTTQTWINGRHIVRCVKVIDETSDVKTFCFMAEQPIMFFFKPGQFVTLELEIDGVQVMRSYTISSSPSVPYSFSVTIKRALGGLVSNWMHENMSEGDDLPVHGPVGLFNSIDFPAKKVLFLSGGVGITPVMSMARWFFDTNTDVDMSFVHSSRTPNDIIFKHELEHMSSRIDNFNLHFICERQATGQSWSGYRGYLDQLKLDLIAPDFIDREVFCCGPESYMNAVKGLLKANNFDMSHYHEESFGETPEADQQDALDQAEIAVEDAISDDQELFEVKLVNSGKSIQIDTNETIYSAVAKLGLHIPKACGVGVCGTCKVRKISGEVEMDMNGGITEEDIAAGYILTCCSKPITNIDLDF